LITLTVFWDCLHGGEERLEEEITREEQKKPLGESLLTERRGTSKRGKESPVNL